MFSYNSWRAWLSGLNIWFDVPRLLGATGWGNGMICLTLTSTRIKQSDELCRMWFWRKDVPTMSPLGDKIIERTKLGTIAPRYFLWLFAVIGWPYWLFVWGLLFKDFKVLTDMSDGTNVQCPYFKDEKNEMLQLHDKCNKRRQFSQSIITQNPFTRWDGFLQNNVHLR